MPVVASALPASSPMKPRASAQVRSWAPVVAMAVIAPTAAGCLTDELEPADTEVGGASLPFATDLGIVGGEVTGDFPSSGMLVVGGTPDVGFIACSATLVGCDRVLTAAHCVCDYFGEGCSGTLPHVPIHMYFQNAGFYRVETVQVHPDYNSNIEHDAAVLTLDRMVTGIRPTLPATKPVSPGTDAVIVGFGRVGGEARAHGIKRRGQVTTEACAPELGVGKLCWLFDGSDSSSDSNVCHGDSGGSTFVVNDDRVELAGIHSTTNQFSCLETPGTVQSADTAVYEHRDFIDSRMIGPTQDICGGLPELGGPGASATTESGTVLPGESADFELTVPRGTAELRVTMNSGDGIQANLDLFVKSSAPASPTSFDCKADGSGAHAACVIASPAPGAWHVQIAPGLSNEEPSDFQLTTTLLAGAPLALEDRFTAAVGQTIAIAREEGVLANDVVTGLGPLLADLVVPPVHGEVQLGLDGSFTYTPASGFIGQDQFSYQAKDHGYTAPAVVRLSVAPDPDQGKSVLACAATGGGGSAGGALLLSLLVGSVVVPRSRNCARRGGRPLPTSSPCPRPR